MVSSSRSISLTSFDKQSIADNLGRGEYEIFSGRAAWYFWAYSIGFAMTKGNESLVSCSLSAWMMANKELIHAYLLINETF